MKEEKDIISIFESKSPILSHVERDRVWNVLESKLPAKKSVPSPYVFTMLTKYHMTPLIVLLILILGGGGTALASDAAKPGDFLFPLDRTLEDIELRLVSSSEKREALTKQFTEERLRELRDIIDEELIVSPSNAPLTTDSSSTTATSATSTLTVDARVFFDTTVVKLELNATQFYFETSTTTRDGVIAEIRTRFPLLTQEEIDAQIDFKVEDRASRPKDRGVISLKKNGETRINTAVRSILSFLDKTNTDSSEKSKLLATLGSEVEGVTRVRRNDDRVRIGSDDNRFEIRVDDNGDSRVEIRNGDTRVRVEDKNGEVRVEKKGKDDEIENVEHTLRSVLTSTTPERAFDVEAKVYTDTTLVRIEFNNDDFTFETDADTRSAVIADIQNRFPALTREQIDAQLDFVMEDRTLRNTDNIDERSMEDDDSEEDDDDHSNSREQESHDGDDEEEDDHRGSSHGGGDEREDEDD